MGCGDKIKRRCVKTPADCVEYDRTLPEFSELTDCVSIADTTEELYDLVGQIKIDIDLTDLESCEDLPIDRNVKSLIQYLIDRDCAQQELIEAQQEVITTLQEAVTELQENVCP